MSVAGVNVITDSREGDHMAEQFDRVEANDDVGIPGEGDPEAPPPTEGEVPPPPVEPEPEPDPIPPPPAPGPDPENPWG